MEGRREGEHGAMREIREMEKQGEEIRRGGETRDRERESKTGGRDERKEQTGK